MGSPVTRSTLRTFSAYRPRRSALVAFRFLSLHVMCGRTSIPSSRLTLQASRLESILARAMGQSAMVRMSTPASRRRSAPAMNLVMDAISGGSSSTAMGLPPDFSFSQKWLTTVSEVPSEAVALDLRLSVVLGRASLIRPMCRGVVPQHPPTILAPIPAMSATDCA